MSTLLLRAHSLESNSEIHFKLQSKVKTNTQKSGVKNGQSELAKIFQEGNANSINNQANHKKRGKTHVTQMPMGFSFASDWLRDMVAWVFSNQSHSEIKHIRCNHRLLATLIWYLPKVLYLGTIKFGRNSELLLQSTTLKEKKWVSLGTLCRSLNSRSFLSWGNWLLNCRLL